MVSAPVGHGAAGILVPITKCAVAALWNIFAGGRLALPHIPIEPRRDGRRGKRPSIAAGRQDGVHVLELANAAVAKQFAGKMKPRIAALLAAGLKDALRSPNRLH